MPEPISSNNSSVYDPARDFSSADGCDASLATCGPPSPPAQPHVVAIEPVMVEGDAGAQALLKQLDADRCSNQRGDAAMSCAGSVLTVAGSGVVAASGFGLVAGLAGITAGVMNCVRVIENYNDCVDEQQARREASQRCEAKDGIPLLTPDGATLVCLMDP